MNDDDSARVLFLISPGSVARTPVTAPVAGWETRRFLPSLRFPAVLDSILQPFVFTILSTGGALRAARTQRPDVVVGEDVMASVAVFLVGMICGVPSVMKPFATDHPPRRSGLCYVAGVRMPHDLWLVDDDGTGQHDALRRAGVASERIRVLPVACTENRAVLDTASPPGATPLIWSNAGSDPVAAVRARDVFARIRQRVPDATLTMTPVDGVRVMLATRADTNKRPAVQDALRAGIPVVAFDTGGTAHIVREGETGLVVPDGDTTAMADAAVDLLTDAALYARISAGACAFAAARFIDRSRRIEIEMEFISALTTPREAGG
jgi:hypothetical protein